MEANKSVVLLIEDKAVEDSPSMSLIEATGATCHRVTTIEEAEKVLQHSAPDVVMVDFTLPDGTAIDLITLLRQSVNHRATPIILLTGEIDPHELERAVMTGIYAFLARPFSSREFTKLLSAAITEEANRVRNNEE